MKKESVVAKRLVICLGCLLLSFVLADDMSAGDVDNTRAVLEKWVETRRIISNERGDWALAREMLNERIELVQYEIESLRGKISEAEKGVTEADTRRTSLMGENDKFKESSSALGKMVIALEIRTQDLLQRLPDPVRERVKPLSQRFPENPEETRLSLSERFQNIVGILNEVNKFNREITALSEVRALPDGTSAEVTTLYVGIGQAYYASANGEVAGIGTSSTEGWVWGPANNVAPQIAEAIAILKNEKVASFVQLPVQIDDSPAAQQRKARVKEKKSAQEFGDQGEENPKSGKAARPSGKKTKSGSAKMKKVKPKVEPDVEREEDPKDSPEEDAASRPEQTITTAASKGQTRLQRIRAKQAKLQAELEAEEEREVDKKMVSKAKSETGPHVKTETSGIPTENSFTAAAATIEQQLKESLTELNAVREQIAAEKIPLTRQLSDLEGELIQARLDYQQTSRLLDSRTLDLSNLRSEIKSRQEETTYISNLLDEYIRNFESRLHIAEIQIYQKPLEAAKLASENSNLSRQKIYEIKATLVAVSIERLYDVLGGARFKGSAVVSSGLVKPGTFVIVGPAALFLSEDGKDIGTAEQRLGSLEPTVIAFETAVHAAAATQLISGSIGNFPLDPTLGNAHKIEATKETLWEHISKGGPVMVPILGLAGAAFLVALYKWLSMRSLRKPPQERIKTLLGAVARHDQEAAMVEAGEITGPVGKMLVSGVEHIKEPPELIEEVMYETVLATRLKLQSLLPFIAISASSAPLLGLLGTVTGIINTFKLITVFGSGDVKTLSSGISEALITTEFGLIVAIPSLLLHAFLSRRARGVTDQMEKAAVAFINQVSKTPYKSGNNGATKETGAAIKTE